MPLEIENVDSFFFTLYQQFAAYLKPGNMFLDCRFFEKIII